MNINIIADVHGINLKCSKNKKPKVNCLAPHIRETTLIAFEYSILKKLKNTFSSIDIPNNLLMADMLEKKM